MSKSLNTLKLVAEEISKDASKIEPSLYRASLRVDAAQLCVLTTAAKFATKCKRNKRLCTRDVERAIELESGEHPIYLLSDNARPIESSNLVYFFEPQVNLKEYITEEVEPVPKVPLAPTFSISWLAVEGVQLFDTETKQQQQQQQQQQQKKGTTNINDIDDAATLTRELRIGQQDKARAAFASVSNDAGIDRLVPHFVRFISNRVASDIMDLTGLWTCVKLAESLVNNEHLDNLDLYLHELVPTLLTCVVGKSLSTTPAENHWALRSASARVIAQICRKYRDKYIDLQPRISQVFKEAIISSKQVEKPLTTRYGGIIGLTALGPHAVDTVLVPFLQSDPFLAKLENVVIGEDDYFKVEDDVTFVTRIEALKVLHALREALIVANKLEDLQPRWELLQRLGYEGVSIDETSLFV